jgi:hypothetical protein
VTRPVHQGEEVLRAIEFHIPEDDHTYRARVQLGGSIEEIDVTPMHSVRHENLRAIGLPGCLMNHSCDPSTLSLNITDDTGEIVGYIQVATRDLSPGDEITCDYVLFDWDSDGHSFQCRCGSPGCFGYVAGFVNLPPEIQEQLADRVQSGIRRKWERTRG